jgi:hypothetical protein
LPLPRKPVSTTTGSGLFAMAGTPGSLMVILSLFAGGCPLVDRNGGLDRRAAFEFGCMSEPTRNRFRASPEAARSIWPKARQA